DPAPWRSALEGGGVVLSHKARDHHLAKHPVGDGVILLVRHPADAVLSDARFFALTQLDNFVRGCGRRPDEATDADAQHLVGMYLNALLQSGSVPKQRRLGFGSWGEHATSWLDELNAQPSLVVRYEDLKQDPLEALRRISVFLGRPVPTTALQAAVTGSDLSAMKRMQEQEIAARTPGRFYEARHEGAYARGLRFVSHGRVGAGLRLPQGALERLGTLWSGPMARLGYRMGPDAVAPLPATFDRSRPLQRPWP
ncbi:MAG: sulfotransferase domain-containing protein, partial [Myxococcota bacterium]|nr:sulfotransferase domain-containing protein [Myxococcota bacterium]